MSNTSARLAAGFLGLTILAALSGCAPKPKPLPPVSAPAPTPTVTPLSVTGVSLGRSLAADKSIADRTDSFAPTDTIYASVRTEGSSSNATIMARWMYEAGQVVEEASQTIAPVGGSSFTEFHVSKPDGWPTGSYAVEVFLNGTSAQRQAFRVN